MIDAYLPQNLPRRESDELIRSGVPSELLDDSWWAHLLKVFSKNLSKRLLVSSFELLHSDEDEESNLRGVSDRERLSLLAAQSAFVYDPNIFHSSKHSPSHRVLSFAKNRMKKGRKDGKPALEEIEEFLVSTLEQFRFYVEDNLEPIHHSFVEKAVPEIELRYCKLPEKQRHAYDKCCVIVRGALALGGDYVDAAKGILKLRRACFHSNTEKIGNTAKKFSGIGSKFVGVYHNKMGISYRKFCLDRPNCNNSSYSSETSVDTTRRYCRLMLTFPRIPE